MLLRGILKGCSCFIITIFFFVTTLLFTLFVKPSKLIISDDTINYIYPLAYENLLNKIEIFLKGGISQQPFSETSFSELEINSGIYYALQKSWGNSIFEKIVINIEKDKITIYGLVTPLSLISNNLKKISSTKTKEQKIKSYQESKTKNFSKFKSFLNNSLKNSKFGIPFSLTFYAFINKKSIEIIPQKASIGLVPIPINIKFIKKLIEKINFEINKNYKSFKGNNKTYLKLKLSKRCINLKMEGEANNKLQKEIPLQRFLTSSKYSKSKNREKIERLLVEYEKNYKLTSEIISEAKKMTKKRN